MKKKKYVKPTIKVHEVKIQQHVLVGSGGCSYGCLGSDCSNGSCSCNSGRGCDKNSYNGDGASSYENNNHSKSSIWDE